MHLSTNELVEALYPEEQARGDHQRKRLYDVLRYLAELGDLRDWWFAGPPRMWRGKPCRPKMWCAPKPKCCPHCGGELAA